MALVALLDFGSVFSRDAWLLYVGPPLAGILEAP